MKTFHVLILFLVVAATQLLGGCHAVANPMMQFDTNNGAVILPKNPIFTNGAVTASFSNNVVGSNFIANKFTLNGTTISTWPAGGPSSSGPSTNLYPNASTPGFPIYFTLFNFSNVAVLDPAAVLPNNISGQAATSVAAQTSSLATNAVLATNALFAYTANNAIQSTNAIYAGVATNTPAGLPIASAASVVAATNAIPSTFPNVQNAITNGEHGAIFDGGAASFSGAGDLTATTFNGAHIGNGSLLTSLNGSAIATGTIPAARLPTLPNSLFQFLSPTNNDVNNWNLNGSYTDSNNITGGNFSGTNGAGFSEDILGDFIFHGAGSLQANLAGSTNLGGSSATALGQFLSQSAANVVTQTVNAIVFGNASINGNTVGTNFNIAGTSIGSIATNGIRLQGFQLPMVNVYYHWDTINLWLTNANGSAVLYSTGTGFSTVQTNGVLTGFQLSGNNYGNVTWAINGTITSLIPGISGWNLALDGTGVVTTNWNAQFLNGAPASVYMQGFYSNVVSLVPMPNTNQVWVSRAGTATANSEYVFQQQAFGGSGIPSGAIYSNILATVGVPNSYVCFQYGGSVSGNFDQHPFYIGPTTNNVCLDSSPTPSCYYFSSIALTAYYTNNDDNGFQGTGINPMPVVSYGTNFVPVTNATYLNPIYYASERTNHLIYVSQTGNDVLASNCLCAFATCQAAKNYALTGDTICVMPGVYQDRDLAKNGVDWKLELGSKISWDDYLTDMAPIRGIFDDYAGAVTSTITGDKIQYSTVWPLIGSAIITTNFNTRLIAKFNEGTPAAYDNSGQSQDVVPGCPHALPNALTTGYFWGNAGCTFASLEINTIGPGTNATRQMLDANTADAAGTYGTFITVTNNDLGLSWGPGEFHIKANDIIVTNVWEQFTSGSPMVLWSDNVAATEQHLFLDAHIVMGMMYDDSPNNQARSWFTVGLWSQPASGVNGQAWRLYGSDLIYYRGFKMEASGNVIDAPGAGFQLWMTLQKITQNGNGDWIHLYANIDYAEFHIDQYNDNSGQMSGGINIEDIGTNKFYSGEASITNKSPVTFGTGNTKAGPDTLFSGMKLGATGTNAAIFMIYTNGLSLDTSDTLISGPTAANSIAAVAPSFIDGGFHSPQGIQAPTNIVHLQGTNYVHLQTLQ